MLLHILCLPLHYTFFIFTFVFTYRVFSSLVKLSSSMSASYFLLIAFVAITPVDYVVAQPKQYAKQAANRLAESWRVAVVDFVPLAPLYTLCSPYAPSLSSSGRSSNNLNKFCCLCYYSSSFTFFISLVMECQNHMPSNMDDRPTD